MRSIITSVSLILGLLLIALGISMARAEDSPKALKKIPVHPTTAMAGKDLFHEYCAVCHGTLGKGNGPAAGALKAPPVDLTQISARNGGKFPELKIQQMINGEDGEFAAAHGSKDMPVWGNIFRHLGPNEEMAPVRVYNLVKYIEELQAK